MSKLCSVCDEEFMAPEGPFCSGCRNEIEAAEKEALKALRGFSLQGAGVWKPDDNYEGLKELIEAQKRLFKAYGEDAP